METEERAEPESNVQLEVLHDMKQSGSTRESPQIESVPKRMFQCMKCNEVLNSSNDLKDHMELKHHLKQKSVRMYILGAEARIVSRSTCAHKQNSIGD